MAWKQADYNTNLLHKKSNYAIDKRYGELSRRVSRMVSTFERHGVSPVHVMHIRQVLDAPNQTRREKERAIMELHRYTLLETSTYAQYKAAQREAIQTWRDIGIGQNYTKKKWREFFQFLEWVKSMSATRYELNSVKEAWELSKNKDPEYSVLDNRIDRAMEIWQSLDNDYI